MKHLLFLLPLLLAMPIATPALASPQLAGEGEILSEEVEPRHTKLVFKVIRVCRDGYCVRIRQIVEVEDTERDGRPVLPDLDAPTPGVTPPAPAPLPQPPVQPPAPSPAVPSPAVPSPAASQPAAARCGTPQESAALVLVNAHRAKLGLSQLRCDPVVLKVARAHSQDMCDRSYFSHTSPEGKQPWDRLRAGGVRFQGAGENIASGYAGAAEVHAGWLASPGHRANIERAGITRAAVGVVDCGGNLIWTQLFVR